MMIASLRMARRGCSQKGSISACIPGSPTPRIFGVDDNVDRTSSRSGRAPHCFSTGSGHLCRLLSTASSEDAHAPKLGNDCRLPRDFLSSLRSLHPDLKISTNSYELDSHGRGESYHPASPPDAVVYPTSEEQIRDLLSLCCHKRSKAGESVVEIVSIIPYGAGTSLEGHLQFMFPDAAEDGAEMPSSYFGDPGNESSKKVHIKRMGGISIDMSNFQSIGEVGPESHSVKVGAGVTRNTLNEALRHTGLQFMVDPGANATLGGMTACGASGTAAVKYGTMRENVLAMKAILPPRKAGAKPDAVNLGCNALKSSAGYDLPALMTGSEGTIGVITEVTVKLHPMPSNVVAASCQYEDLHSAANAVAMIRAVGIPVLRIELLDETSIKAFNASLGSDAYTESKGGGGDDAEFSIQAMDVKPSLFMEFAGHSEASAIGDMEAAREICTDLGGANFASASDESTRNALWAARHRLYYSAIALRGSSGDDDEGATSQSTIVTDVCVPLSHFADIISSTARDVREKGVIGPCFGHAGDGNFHCVLPLKESDAPEYREKVTEIVRNMVERAMAVGGTCTGEHGVGYGKMKYLPEQYGEGAVSMMKAVKQSLDPFNIMNPGKVVA